MFTRSQFLCRSGTGLPSASAGYRAHCPNEAGDEGVARDGRAIARQ